MIDCQHKKIEATDVLSLQRYFSQLDEATIKRFSPHPITESEANRICTEVDIASDYYVSLDRATNDFIAYAAVTSRFPENDLRRLSDAGITVSQSVDCTFAPSVAPAFQGKGVAKELFHFVAQEQRKKSKHRMFLWGGVQADNIPAVKFYERLGFVMINSFWRNNQENYNMVMDLETT